MHRRNAGKRKHVKMCMDVKLERDEYVNILVEKSDRATNDQMSLTSFSILSWILVSSLRSLWKLEHPRKALRVLNLKPGEADVKQILSVSFHQVPEIRWMPLVQLEVQSVDIVAGVGCHLMSFVTSQRKRRFL